LITELKKKNFDYDSAEIEINSNTRQIK